MAIEWSDSLATGVEWQDRQHKELFRRINSLIEAMNVGLGKEEVLRLLSFLDEYFVVHFEAEEQAMSRFKYPGTITHLAEHMDFIEKISAFERECKGGVASVTVVKVQRTVVDWLISHVGTADRELGRFILDAQKTTEQPEKKA